MRALGAVLLLLITSFFAMTAPTMAQSSLRTCAGVDLTAPADGAVLDDGYRTNFTWDSEPRGTASREWVSVRVDGDGNVSFDDAQHKKAEPRVYKGFARGRPGIYAWVVIFYDAKGNPICMSEAGTYVIPGTGVASIASDGSTSGAAKAALGRYVVKLAGSSYAGAFNREVAGNDYDDLADATGNFDWKAQGYTGLDVHGNNNANRLRGSNQGDNIWGYGGNDEIYGRGGDDIINGGNESCSAKGFLASCSAGDWIDGGSGNDIINGGDESCSHSGVLSSCAAGDIILGGDGNDVIHGNGGNDAISGDNGEDKVFGDAGNDAVTGNYPLGVPDGDRDEVSGGPGVDIVVGTGADVVNQN